MWEYTGVVIFIIYFGLFLLLAWSVGKRKISDKK